VKPETESMLSLMLGAPNWTRRYGRDKIAAALQEYAAAAQCEPGMLPGAVRPAPAELVEQARERASPRSQPRPIRRARAQTRRCRSCSGSPW
jgi:hypothetical protein